jgi:hypothetical protein
MKKLLYLFLLIFVVGCKTAQIPVIVERTKTEYKDRLRVDSIYSRDSIFLYVKGDTVRLEKYIYRYQDRLVRDTVSRVDSIPVPYAVTEYIEKDLNWFQKTLMWTGGIVLLLLVVYLFYRTNKKWQWITKLIKLVIK